MNLHQDSAAPLAHAIRCQVLAALSMAPDTGKTLADIAEAIAQPPETTQRAIQTLAGENIICMHQGCLRVAPARFEVLA